MRAIYLLSWDAYDTIYPPEVRGRIAGMAEVAAPPQTRTTIAADPSPLADAEVILSGWGCPPLDAALLDAAPRLRAVLYGAGSIKSVATEAFWERGVAIATANSALAVPVAEYTLGHILLALKSVWQHALLTRRERTFRRLPVAGAYGSTVGLLSLGAVGRAVVERLRPFDVRVIVYDPFTTPEQAAALGVELAGVEEIFARADVVSLHTPWLPETEGLVTGAHIGSMKPYATFINSARGAVVREGELAEALARRPDLVAVLDVTHPEPPPPDSPLYELPNVILTPHIAGALEAECRRMGELMADELGRLLAGEPLRFQVTREMFHHMA